MTPESTPEAAAEAPVGFATLGLLEPLVAAIVALGYEEPTPIQRAAIPLLLSGKDLVGQAGTGTGKTAAFALPLVHRLASDTGPITASPRGFILVPTRELAMQVAEAIHKYSKGSGLAVVPVYGGAPMEQQIRALRRGADIVVATPGRALDLLRRETLDLESVQLVVLDEADEMLDMGFAEDLDAILNATPANRQTALFAATMAPRIAAIAGRHLREPARVTIAREPRSAGQVPRVRQTAYIVPRFHKPEALAKLLDFESPTSTIIFCRTRIEVDELTDTLTAHGYAAKSLHGGMDQRDRDRVMNAFRSTVIEILVATDVAARGIDIDHVSHVVNYDLPSSAEVYVHRIGRTGRIGREGVAITLVEPRESRYLRSIEGLTKQRIEVLRLPTARDLRARRLENTSATLRERLGKGKLEEMRTIVESLAEEFDIFDIAAAALSLVHDESEPAAETAPSGLDRPPQRDFSSRQDFDRRPSQGSGPRKRHGKPDRGR